MKIAGWLALVVIIQIIVFSAIFTPHEMISQYGILLALCLSLYTGIAIRD